MKEMAEQSGEKPKPRTDYERHLKYYDPDAEANQFDGHKDGPPTFGGKIARVRGGHQRSTSKVAQSGFDEKGEPTVVFQVNSGRRLTKLTPIEEEVGVSIQHKIDPKTATSARKQRFAIRRKSGRK